MRADDNDVWGTGVRKTVVLHKLNPIVDLSAVQNVLLKIKKARH